jgi:hypothetical protein
MKSVTVVTFILAFAAPLLCAPAFAQVDFDRSFNNETLRIDYYHTGNHDREFVTLDRISRLDIGWAGNPRKPIDDYNQGSYFIKVYDTATSTLLYSRGFSSIVAEYRTTQPAIDGKLATYYSTALIPDPKVPVTFVLEDRDRENRLHPFFTLSIDPEDIHIKRRKPFPGAERIAIHEAGNPHVCVDIVMVGESYRREDRAKFVSDATSYSELILLAEPFKSHRDKINVWGVFHPSADAGVDQPELGARRGGPIFKETILDASFNALDTPRYLLVDDLRTLYDLAVVAPCDKLVVLANETRYGGGGIYNYYTVSTVDNSRSRAVFMHEFGHAFASLADEYVGGVAYVEIFPEGVEPMEVNITRLLDPANIKWKHLLTPGVPIPTPNEPRFRGMIGAFEGAGYLARGMYRSESRQDFYDSRENRYGVVAEEGVRKAFMLYINE